MFHLEVLVVPVKKCLQLLLPTFLCSLLVLVVIFVLYMMRHNNYWKQRGIPYIKPKPVFGNAFKFFMLGEFVGDFFLKCYRKCTGPFIGIYILDEPALLIKDLDLVKNILIKDFDHFTNRSPAINPEHDPVGSKTLFVSRVPEWYNDRKSISPIFTSGKLKSKTPQLSQLGKNMTRAIKKKITEEGNLQNVKDITNKYTVNTITTTFFGLCDDTFEDQNSPFLALTETMWNWNAKWLALQTIYMFMAPEFFELFRMNFMDGNITNFFRDVTWKLLNNRDKIGTNNKDLIDVLLDIKHKKNIVNSDSYDADTLAAHVCTVFAAGYETSSTTLTLALFELAKKPECQELARNEIREVLKQHGEMLYAAIQDLHYVRNCLLETLRLYPIDTIVDRRCTKDYKIPGTDHVIEKGTAIFIPVWGIQLDEEYYSNPLEFEPERFSEENIKQRPDLSFLAFGGGPRYCPGKRFALLSSTMCLANILMNFEVRLPEGAPRVVEMNVYGMTVQPKDDILLKFMEI